MLRIQKVFQEVVSVQQVVVTVERIHERSRVGEALITVPKVAHGLVHLGMARADVYGEVSNICEGVQQGSPKACT